MPFHDLDYEELTKSLTDNFNVLADEVQLLSDRNTILQHKLRFAAEQYQYLADKYAPGDSKIASTLAKLQLPPDLQVLVPERGGFVPLPGRGRSISKQEAAVAIRDGRRAAQRLAGIKSVTGSTVSGGRSISGASSNIRYSAQPTSLSTVLEQDFTVPGKKSSLLCPFATPTMNRKDPQRGGTLESDRPLTPSDTNDLTPHQASDPICAAMYAETMTSPPPSQSGSAAKCPIRYLDQHSPEEVARYFETHKHEIPRSHEVCVKRYQRNEDDIRKLDAKYGNLVSMIQGLGQKHQPMLPAKQDEIDEELERTSNERVENWAKAVSADGVGQEDTVPGEDEDRESRFDRPMKEIRVGESPSRPWGISVPIFDQAVEDRPASPPPAPVSSEHLPKSAGKCPFGHGEQAKKTELNPPAPAHETAQRTGKCPFGHGQVQTEVEAVSTLPAPRTAAEQTASPAGKCPLGHDQKTADKPTPRVEAPTVQTQPTFINPADVSKMAGTGPQMIFTGPVFIGYPMEQALAFMQQLKSAQ